MIATLTRFPDGKVVWSDTKTLASKSLELDLHWNSPELSGVYQLDVVGSPRGAATRWWPKKVETTTVSFAQKTYIVDVQTGPDEQRSDHGLPPWEEVKQIDLSFASRKFAEAWQTFRHTFSGNSWFDMTLNWPELSESTETETHPEIASSLATPMTEQMTLLHKLRSGQASRGPCFVLPPKQAYQCDLPAVGTNQSHRLTLDYDPTQPVHLSLQWFREGVTEPIATKRIDFVPTVDSPTQWASRRFVYRVDGDCHLKIINLDRHQPAKFSSILIEKRQGFAIASPDKPSVEADKDSEAEMRNFDVWIDGFMLDRALSDAGEEITAPTTDHDWSFETDLAGRVCKIADDLRLLTNIWNPDQIWITCPEISSEIDGSQLDQAIGLLRKELPTLRMVCRSMDQCHESVKQHLEIVGSIGDKDGMAQSVDDRLSVDRSAATSVVAKFSNQSERHYVVVEQDSNDRMPPLSILSATNLVQKILWNRSPFISPLEHGLVVNDSPRWNRCIDAWRQWSNIAATPIDSVDPSNQTVSVHVNAKKQIAISNHSPWRTMVHMAWSNADPTDLIVCGNVVVDQSRKDTCRLEIAPGGLSVIQSPHVIRSWSATIPGGIETVDAIKTRVTQVVERVGMLSVPPLEDDLWRSEFSLPVKFATQSRRGEKPNLPVQQNDLSPWLHAQHPEGCVIAILDEIGTPNDATSLNPVNHSTVESNTVQAERCVEMRSLPEQSGRTWLVSPTFQPDASGRLAISLRCRALTGSGSSDPAESSTLSNTRTAPVNIEHPLEAEFVMVRVSLEGIEEGVPVRLSRSLKVSVREGWRNYPMVLETVGWEPHRVKSLRTTIDLLSPGVIRIDDVRVHRRFATTAQQESLQKLAFLAIQGFKRGNLTQSAKLLSNIHVDELLFRPEYQPSNELETKAFASSTKNSSSGSTFAVEKPARSEAIDSETPLAPANEANQNSATPPAVSSRWRIWWPQTLRF